MFLVNNFVNFQVDPRLAKELEGLSDDEIKEVLIKMGIDPKDSEGCLKFIKEYGPKQD